MTVLKVGARNLLAMQMLSLLALDCEIILEAKQCLPLALRVISRQRSIWSLSGATRTLIKHNQAHQRHFAFYCLEMTLALDIPRSRPGYRFASAN